MMKKLMVLSLVLAVVGLANAALSVDAADSVWGVISDNGSSYIANLVWENPADVKVTAFALTAAGNKDLSYTDGPYVFSGADLGSPTWATDDAMYGVISFSAASSTVGALPAGKHFEATFDKSFGLAGSRVMLVSEDFTQVLATSFAVPEPMTMGLLSLGALFIRKRK